jgi:hypothetical protein
LLALAAGGSLARANPAGTVPTQGYAGEQVHATVDYEYQNDRAVVTREHAGDPAADPQGALPIQRQLEFHQSRQLVTPKVEAGIYRGLWLSFAVPIVIAQSSELDQLGGTDRATLTTFTDGILPVTGFDAQSPTVPPAGDVVFRGIDRSGVLELRGGLGWAPMNQALDDTLPTWKLGAELHLSVGRAMKFDPVNPGQETGVASGVDELRLWTSVDRRYRYFETWFEAYWQVPLYTQSSGLFTDPGFGATKIAPAQTAGASFGVEAYTYEDTRGHRVTVSLGARAVAHFSGRGYSEMWEAFALAGDRRTAGPLVLDGDPTKAGVQGTSHPGITNLESYLETAARLAVVAELGHHWRLTGSGEAIWKTDHVISFAGEGVDLPTCPTGAPACETASNTTVDAGTAEVNPLHVPLIDQVGHRYQSEDNFGFVLGLQAAFAFSL